MFKFFDDVSVEEKVTFSFDGVAIKTKPGITVAAALLASGRSAFRNTPVSGASRGPFCMMGACYDCLVSVNGETVQACMTIVKPGLRVQRAPVPVKGE